MEFPEADVRRQSRAFLVGGAAALGLVAAGVGALVLSRRAGLARETQARHAVLAAGPHLKVVPVGAGGTDRSLTLQGEALPAASTTVYAKLSGFVRQLPVDRGDRVAAGQTLAVLESPETDREAQAQKADAENRRRNADRAAALGRQQLLSAREVEQAEAEARMAEARAAAQATLKGYQVLKAPFAGVVTQRFVDVGALVQNGGSSSGAQPIVTVAETRRLRVVLYLDQPTAAQVKAGMAVEILSAENPALKRSARISRLGGALDSRTRTLAAEVDLDNRDQAFLPGAFVQVRLKVAVPPGVEVPWEAVVLREGRPMAFVVGADRKVQARALQLGDEAGGRITVRTGLQAGDKVVLHAPTNLQDGDLIQPVEEAPK